jgi:hypothetical protein
MPRRLENKPHEALFCGVVSGKNLPPTSPRPPVWEIVLVIQRFAPRTPPPEQLPDPVPAAYLTHPEWPNFQPGGAMYLDLDPGVPPMASQGFQ